MTIFDSNSRTAHQWREGTDDSSPAGALYANGAFAVADMIGSNGMVTAVCGTVCTGSAVADCC